MCTGANPKRAMSAEKSAASRSRRCSKSAGTDEPGPPTSHRPLCPRPPSSPSSSSPWFHQPFPRPCPPLPPPPPRPLLPSDIMRTWRHDGARPCILISGLAPLTSMGGAMPPERKAARWGRGFEPRPAAGPAAAKAAPREDRRWRVRIHHRTAIVVPPRFCVTANTPLLSTCHSP